MDIEQLLLPHEDHDAYLQHLAGLVSAHQPSGAHQQWLVEEFALASWTWRRARAVDEAFWEYIGGHYNRGNTGIAEALAQEKEVRFRPHLRQMAQAERQYYRALAALERMTRPRGRPESINSPAVKPAPEERSMAAAAEPSRPTEPASVDMRHFFHDNQLTRTVPAWYSEPCERARLTPCAGLRVEMKPGHTPGRLIKSPLSVLQFPRKTGKDRPLKGMSAPVGFGVGRESVF